MKRLNTSTLFGFSSTFFCASSSSPLNFCRHILENATDSLLCALIGSSANHSEYKASVAANPKLIRITLGCLVYIVLQVKEMAGGKVDVQKALNTPLPGEDIPKTSS